MIVVGMKNTRAAHCYEMIGPKDHYGFKIDEN